MTHPHDPTHPTDNAAHPIAPGAASPDDGAEDARVGDVYERREDGDICRVTAVYAQGHSYDTDLHDRTFGAPTRRDLRTYWKRIARDVSPEAFRAMRCSCCASRPGDENRQTPSGEGSGA
jgi:hypothetical protein